MRRRKRKEVNTKRERIYSYVLLGLFTVILCACVSATWVAHDALIALIEHLPKEVVSQIEMGKDLEKTFYDFFGFSNVTTYVMYRLFFISSCWLAAGIIIYLLHRRHSIILDNYCELQKKAKALVQGLQSDKKTK